MTDACSLSRNTRFDRRGLLVRLLDSAAARAWRAPRAVPALLMLLALSGCSDDPAQAQLAAAHAIHALDARSGVALLDTPECKATEAKQPASSPAQGPAILQTPVGNIALLTGAEAAGLPAEQARGLAAVILLSRDAEPSLAWAHPTPLVRHGDWTQPPGSALQTLRSDTLRRSTVSWEGWLFTLVGHLPATGSIRLLAVEARHPGLDPVDRNIVWLPAAAGDAAETARLHLLTTELLYSHVFSQDPEAGMRLAVVTNAQAPIALTGGEFTSQAVVLRRLALARQCAAAVAARKGAAKPVVWQVAVLEALTKDNATQQVQARLRGSAGPLSDHKLIFTRQPHFECSGQTGADGELRCDLTDLMGHDGHPGFERAPVIVSFPGKVDAERIVLPTAALLTK